MNTREAIKLSLDQAEVIVQGYLGDLTDADLLVRPVDGANHIAWQLGHLIASAHWMMDAAYPGSMPALPDGFGAKYKSDTATSNDPAAFHKKDEFLSLAKAQRDAILATLDKQTDADFDRPAPESLRHFLPTIGHVFNMQGAHWLMHAGQWAVIRRKLGRKPLF